MRNRSWQACRQCGSLFIGKPFAYSHPGAARDRSVPDGLVTQLSKVLIATGCFSSSGFYDAAEISVAWAK
jgi:hypothetical protein